MWLTTYGNDLGNHTVSKVNDLGNHMVFKVITIYGQPYDFKGQPYGSRSTRRFKIKNSTKSPYPTYNCVLLLA
jgi:hypothetical protein